LYLSVPFTWLLPTAQMLAERYNGKVVAGGPAVDLMGAPWADETPKWHEDVLYRHNPDATFTTRGCPNRCPFCAVPKLEGRFRELVSWRPAPIICDNNLLECSTQHFLKVIRQSLLFPYVDFNQGLDARKFTTWHASQIARLKKPIVRFAFDTLSVESRLADAIQTAKSFGLRDIRIYVLIGFDDDPESALYRLETVRQWGRAQRSPVPIPMRYQPLDAVKKNSYVRPGWTERELFDMCRFYSNLSRWRNATFAEYVETGGFGNRKV
jgi:hypothetical protein